MKSFQICFLLILTPIVRGQFNVIQCYVCDDCDVFDDCLLQSCPQITISTTSSTTTKQTTLVAETSSAMPTPSPMPTPTPPLTSSIRPSTVATVTYPTAASEKPTQPLTPTDATRTTTEPTTISTETLETSDTAAAEDSTTTTKIPSSTTSETAEQTTAESTLQPEQSTENAVNGLETALSYRSVQLYWPVFSYHCYSIDIVENNRNKKRRGCVKVPVNKSGCTVLKDEFGCSAKNCRLCSLDRCNSCHDLRYSMPALMMCVVIGFILK